MRAAVQFCTAADATTLAWAATGAGPVVVKVPGWISDVGLDWEGSPWSHWYHELARGRRLLAYDPRGSGWSSRSPAAVDFEALVGDLGAVVDAAGLERFALFSSGIGAPVAVAYAARHPGRVTQLLLHGAAAVGALAPAAGPAANAEAEAMARLLESSWGRDPMVIDQFLMVQLLPDAGPEAWRRLGPHQQRAAAPAMAARLFRAYESADVTRLCARVKCPVLVTHSSADARVPGAACADLARRLRGRCVEVDSRNHFLLAHEPAWAQWQELARAFLPSRAERPRAPLSARESQVLALLARGLDNAAIAQRLFVSEKTVRNNVSAIFDKLGVATRAEAIVAARAEGLDREPA